MICPGCQEAADKAKAQTGSAGHLPFKCRDIGLPPNSGCTCQHDKGVVPHVSEEGLGLGSGDPPAPNSVPDHR